MALGDERLRSIIESLLLISPDPVPAARLVEVIRIEDPHTDEESVRAAIAGLLEAYGSPDRRIARGFRVEDVAGGLQLRTVAENAPYVRRYLAAKPQRLSKAALETLAIIAYRQPVTKPEIEAIRGVDAGAALRSLLERELVKIVGKKDEVGRPLIYGTTPYFLEFFTLKSLGELPTLREFHELDEASLEEVAAVEGAPSVRDLAEAAQFLVEQETDPDMDALEAAVKAADAAKAAAELALDPTATLGKMDEGANEAHAMVAEAEVEPLRATPNSETSPSASEVDERPSPAEAAEDDSEEPQAPDPEPDR